MKKQFTDVLDRYKAERLELSLKCTNYKEKAKGVYMPDVINKQVAEYESDNIKAIARMKVNTGTILRSKLSELEKADSKDFDTGHQLRLSNVINILQISAKGLDDEEVRDIAKPFANDPTALRGIRDILISNGRESIEAQELLPVNTKHLTIKKLNEVNRFIERLTLPLVPKDNDPFSDHNITVSLDYFGLEGIIAKLDDDLNYGTQGIELLSYASSK